MTMKIFHCRAFYMWSIFTLCHIYFYSDTKILFTWLVSPETRMLYCSKNSRGFCYCFVFFTLKCSLDSVLQNVLSSDQTFNPPDNKDFWSCTCILNMLISKYFWFQIVQTNCFRWLNVISYYVAISDCPWNLISVFCTLKYTRAPPHAHTLGNLSKLWHFYLLSRSTQVCYKSPSSLPVSLLCWSGDPTAQHEAPPPSGAARTAR